MSAPRNNSQIRCNNIRILLRTIIQSAPVSKRELQSMTGLSWGAVSTLVSELFQNGYIVSAGKQTTFVGRKPFELDVNNKDNYIIGIDLNLEGICGVVCDIKGEIICERLRLFPKKDYDCIIGTLFSLLDEIVNNEYREKNILGIGVAVQGIVDVEEGISKYIPRVENWSDVPIRNLIEERYSLKTKILHDPDCLMIAEKNFGESYMKIASNALLVRLDDSIGLSVMTNKNIYYGFNGKSGEFGHVPVNMDGPVCVCGNKGCLGEYASGGGVVRRFIDAVNAGRKTVVDLTSISSMGCKAIGIAARQGDQLSCEIFNNMGKYLGFALSGIANIMNPDLIVIYGVMTEYKSLFSESLTRQLQSHLYKDTRAKIIYSTLGRNAAARGVAFSVSEEFVESLVIDTDISAE